MAPHPPGTEKPSKRERLTAAQVFAALNEIRPANTVLVPAGKVIHAIVDNYATHKQPKVPKWLVDHPRWTFHFTPTSASWLNAVKGFFSAVTRRRIRRGPFHSVDDLQNAITRYINAHNSDCRPFTWTTSAKAIFEKLAPIPASSV